MKHNRIWCVLLALCILSGCGKKEIIPEPVAPIQTPAEQAQAKETANVEILPEENLPKATFQPTNSVSAQPPSTTEERPFADAQFHETEAVDGVKLDLSATAEGYVAVSAISDSRLKFQVLKDDTTYTYNMASDGTPSIFPLQGGNGLYTFKVMENVKESQYARKYAVDAEVQLIDEFQPYLRPSDYVPYSRTSQCVLEAAELASGAETELDIVRAVFDYVCEKVEYDEEKAQNVEKNYLPDPDETLRTGKGICFDYAALAAAMLRSQGVPTRMIFGYVSPDDLYHAWNMFYTEETGWVTVNYQVSEKSWNRLDLTFSANGADDKFIGDGGNYVDVYFY